MKNMFNGASKSVKFDLTPAKDILKNNESNKSHELSLAAYYKEHEKKRKSKDWTDACYDAKMGSFTSIRNDFSRLSNGAINGHFQNDPSWSAEEVEKVRKFRFVVASLVLVGFALCLMSRMVLSVGIVSMTAKPTLENITNEEQAVDNFDEKRAALEENEEGIIIEIPTIKEEEEVYLDWSTAQKNYLIASFYVGYAPTMMFTGGLANKYGSWYPLFIAVFSSVFFNAITPFVAYYSYSLLVTTRVLLGILQGCIMPAAYDIFNRWLTLNEASIFVPMIKVSFAVGSLLGNALPGVTTFLGYRWPMMFYECSFLCAIWSVLWFFLATSTPQSSNWVEPSELKRIMRKKQQVSVAVVENGNDSSNACKQAEEQKEESTPWLLIMFSPSVLALALTKFTYNIGMDFVCLELPIYLRNIHNTEQEIISSIGSAGCLLQATFITFIGWLARYVVQNKSFGLSKSKWRKIFQGSSNFGMALAYFIIIFAKPNFNSLVLLLLLIFFSWMLGAGGESLIPYDLSTKYPATIMGYAHSFGVLSSVVLPPFCTLILGEADSDPAKWNLIFVYLASACTLGGLAFILIVRPKPFLPGEKEEYEKNKIGA